MYAKEFEASLQAVEAAREANIAYEPARMTAQEKDELLAAINTGSTKKRGTLWYSVGRYVYVPLAVILCLVALFMQVAF